MAVDDDLRTRGQLELCRDLLRVEIHQAVHVEVARAGDVPLARIARVPERPVVLVRGPHVHDRDLVESPNELVELDVAHSARTTSSSAATAGLARERLQPCLEPVGQRHSEHLPSTKHPGHVGDVAEEAQADRKLLEAGVELVVLAAPERVVVVAEQVVEAVNDAPGLRAVGQRLGAAAPASGAALRGTP